MLNLRDIFFPAQASAQAATDTPSPDPTLSSPAGGNVVSLLPAAAVVDDTRPANATSAPRQVARKGLLNLPELREFFSDNHFGLGRHDGANYRTQEALAQGKAAIACRFQNIVDTILEQKRSTTTRLEDALLQTEGVCANTTARLRLALGSLESDMVTLRGQHDQAGNGKGWVLEALNRYQIGFGKGMREAIEFELLGQ